MAGLPVHQAYLGTCTNGRLSDLHEAVAVLRGKHIAPGVRLLVIPASRSIFQAALADGTIAALVDAGAMVGRPGAGHAWARTKGLLAPGGSAASRPATGTSRGAWGSKDAEVFLGSPSRSRASALTGVLTDPAGSNVMERANEPRADEKNCFASRAFCVGSFIASLTLSVREPRDERIQVRRRHQHGPALSGTLHLYLQQWAEILPHLLEDLDKEFAGKVGRAT